MADLLTPSFHPAQPVARRSPLAGWHDAFAALPPAVHVAERPFLIQLNVRAEGANAAALEPVLGGPLPAQPCAARPAGRRQLLWLGPDEWLILAEPDERQLEAALCEVIGAGSVTDVSAQRTAMTLAGPAAAGILAGGCAIDLHPSRAPAGTCVQTMLARAGVIIVVRDSTASSFDVLVRSSFAEYLAAWIVDACIELGDT